jgi:inosose dehydratase
LQLPPRRVLGEMRDLGITATELGALGWLPTDADELRSLLDEFGLSLVGGFVPLVLHRADAREQLVADATTAARTLAAGGARHFVTAVVSSHAAWERPVLDAAEWSSLFDSLALVDEICGDHGLSQVVHPHVDTLIESSGEFERFLDHSGVGFCLDTGHLFIGGVDTVVVAGKYFDRIGLVHVKDVRGDVAQLLLNDELTLMGATQAGLFPAAGAGDAPIAATIQVLEDQGFSGWYVLEQDVALTDGEPPAGEGPVVGVRSSIDYLRSLAATSRQ